MINVCTFDNFGFIHHKLSEKDIPILLNEIDEMQKNNFLGYEPKNDKLAGSLEKEFGLSEETRLELSDIVMPLIQTYDEKFDYLSSVNVLTKDLPFVLGDPWVNFQKKHEYNPIHCHRGVFSFVIWIKVPYEIENEMKNKSSINSNMNTPGHFNFHYTNILGGIENRAFPVDKTWEYQMFFFPARLNHSVNPFFTSDEYRISVSGNILLDAG